MYGIPRDVLETYLGSATFENQEKARLSHVSYTLQPKGNDFMNSLEVYFGYEEKKKNIEIEWSHLPLMQVAEKEKSEAQKIKIDSLTSLLSLGVPIEEANKFLGLNFTIEEPKPVDNGQGGQTETQGQQGQQEETS